MITSLKELSSVSPLALPEWVKPVGISAPVNMGNGGGVATKITGNGDGIFNKVINAAKTLWSVSQAGTKSSEPDVVKNVGQTTHTYVDQPSQPGGDDTILVVGVAVIAAKLLNVF